MAFTLARPPETDDELWELVYTLWGVKIPRQKVCAGHCAPFDAFAHAFFARSPVCVWKACVPGDAPVLTTQGPRPAATIEIGTTLWSWDQGMVPAQVTDRWFSGVQQTVIIRTRAGEVTCTPNHVVLVGRETGWRRYEHHWIQASEIEPGDVLIRPEGFGDGPTEDVDLAEIAGLLLADGHIEKYKFLIAHHREATYMPHYEAVVERVFGKSLRRDDANRCSWLHSKAAADRCRVLGLGGTAHTKRVPAWVFEMGRNSKLAFLRGFLDGDGTVRSDGVEFFSCNRWLMEDIRSLAMMVGLRVGRVRCTPMAGAVTVAGRVVNRGDMYVVRVYDLASIGSNDPKYVFNSVTRQRPVFHGQDWVGHRVLSVEPGDVVATYDLEVSGTEAFVCDGYVVHNSRGFGGKSYLLAVLGMTEAVVLGCDVNLLGASENQSRNVHEHMYQLWDSKLAPKQILEHFGPTEMRLSNKARVRPLTASQKTVRGPHPAKLLLDEIDEMDLAILDAAMGQPMPQRGIEPSTVMSSTHQYPDATMAEVLMRAEDKDWPVFTWCYFETSNLTDGWLSPSTIEAKRDEVSAEMFKVEYDLQEPSLGTRAIDTSAVETMFFEPVVSSPNMRKGGFEQHSFEKPQRTGEYVTGADWAKEVDFTVISTWRTDCHPWKLVCYTRGNRRPWPVMVGWYNKQFSDYGGKAIHDGTGVGNVVNDYIDARSLPFLMTGRQRDEMLTEYVAAVERGDLSAPRIESAYLSHKFCSIEAIYGRGKDDHLPDEVCSFALAWHMNRRKIRRGIPVGMERLNAETGEPANVSPYREIGGVVQVTDPGYFSLTV